MECLQFIAIISFSCALVAPSLAGTPRSASACFQEKNVTLSCGYGYKLRITRTFFGYNQHGQCSYQPGDCIEEERRLYPCVGMEFCSINLPSGGIGPLISSCGQNSSNYFQAEYECIPDEEIMNICETPLITAQQGYLVTPSYPNKYGSHANCTTRIQLESYQHLQLYIYDLELEMVNNACSDYILVQDSTKTLTLCGKRWNERSPVSWNDLTLRLSTNGLSKGFWLKFQATPPRTTTTRRPTTPMLTRPKPPVIIDGNSNSNVIPITKTVNNVNVEKSEKLPFAAIVGGVIGTLSFVLVILLVLLIVKWSRERKRRRAKNQFIEVQNPGYRNSNEFQQNSIPRTDVCYNYVDC